MKKLKLIPKIANRTVFPKMSQMSLSITYDCNQRCKTCNIWRINKENPELRKRELSFLEICEILDMNQSLMWVTFAGGEPFLRWDMDNILRKAVNVSNLNVITITTNGSLPRKIENDINRALLIKSGCNIIVVVSMNGTKENHNNIAGVASSYDRAMETYERLSKIKNNRLEVNLGFTLSKYNVGQLSALNGYSIVVGAAMNSKYTGADDGVSVDVNTVHKEFSGIRDSSFSRLMRNRHIKRISKNGKFNCVAGQYSCLVDPYGNVYNCAHFIGGIISNLRETNYKLELSNDLSDVKNCSGCLSTCESYHSMIFKPWRML